MHQSTDINIVGRISHFFTTHKPLSLVLLISALAFGLASFYLTPKQYNPEIKRPAFAISLTYTGASIDSAVNKVAYELTEKVQVVPGVEDVYVEVSDGAEIRASVIFEVGHDTTKAKVDLLSQLEQHKYLAKGFISKPRILEINPETIPVLQVVFGSTKHSRTELRERVVDLSHTLARIENVSDVSVRGSYQQGLIVAVDPTKLRTHTITLPEVERALKSSQTRRVFDGITHNPYQIEMVYDARGATAEAVGSRVVRDGVRIRDVADVYMGSSDTNRSYVLHKGSNGVQEEVVMLSIAKVEGSSAPQVTEAVRAHIDTLVKNEGYAGITYSVVGDDGETATREIGGLTKNLITAIAIVAGILFLFLSFRSALVVLVAIPLTLLIVFGLGYVFGETINRITLFALILSLGLLVDSAIVVVENIYTHLRRAREQQSTTKKDTVIARAVHEIGIGLLLSTVTSVIVFLPMRYITGMMGPYMGPIAFFVPAALIVSFFVAIVITPFVASRLLGGEEKETPMRRGTQKVITYVTGHYTRFLRTVIYSRTNQKRLLGGAVLVLGISLLLPLFGLVHFKMLPRADQNQLYVYLDAPTGTAVEETRNQTETLVTYIEEHPQVESIQSFIGTGPILDFNGMFKGAQNRTGTHQSTLRVNLTPAQERTRSSSDIVSELRHGLATHSGILANNVRFMEEPPGPPVRATFVAKIANPVEEKRTLFAEKLYTYIETVEGVVDRHIYRDDAVGRVVYTVNHDALKAYGVSEAEVVRMVRLLEGGVDVTEYMTPDTNEYTPVVLKAQQMVVHTPAHIDTLSVLNNVGEAVPLSSVIDTHYEPRPSMVTLEDASYVTYVTAEVEGRSIVYVVIEVMKALISGAFETYTVEDWDLFSLTMHDPTGAVIELTWGGEWEMTLENFRDLGVAMMVALFLVYTILVAQYNTFKTPAFILVTVPLGLVGILWGFLVLDTVFGIYLTATALIGFIALIGLVVNNAIIYLEYVEQAKRTGAAFKEALVQAGEARLRPIALTSLTTILGSLTIAGDPVWSGLAWAIVFGLSLSTVLTLVIYPTLLVFFTKDTH